MSEQINGLNIPSLQVKPVNFQQGQSPALQGITPSVEAENIKKSVDNSYLANRVKASEDADPRAKAALTVASWYGISQGMDYFNKKSNGEYLKSIPGRLGNLGDKFATKTWLGRKIEAGLHIIDKKTAQWATKSQFWNTIRNFSTQADWKWVRGQGQGTKMYISTEGKHIFEEFLSPITKGSTNVQKLEQYGISQKEINAFAKRLAGKTSKIKALALQKKELAILGADSKVVERIAKHPKGLKNLQKYAEYLKIKAMGFSGHKEFNKFLKDFETNPEKVLETLENITKNKKMSEWGASIWRKQGGVCAKIGNNMVGRFVKFKEVFNRYLATFGKGNHTKIGKSLPKGLSWLVEGATNRWAGGKLGAALQATFLADMLYHTITAPKGEKTKTFAERFVNDLTYFIALPIGYIAMHKLGGFKYAGLKDQKAIDAFRKAREAFNKRVAKGFYKNKESYNTAYKALMNKLGYKNIKNPFVKILNRIGRFINIGNERIASYKSPNKLNMNLFRKIANGNILGIPMRIAIPLMVISPFLAKTATKTMHAIFGKPTKSVLDEDKEEEQPKTAETIKPQATPQQQVAKTIATNAAAQKVGDTNLIRRTTGNATNPSLNKPARTYIPSPEPVVLNKPETKQTNGTKPNFNGNNTESDTNLIRNAAKGNTTTQQTEKKENQELEPQRTYIPSPQGMVPKAPDTSAADKALADADAAEKFVNETLAKING